MKTKTNKKVVFVVRQRASQRLKRAYFRIYQTSSTYIKHAIGTLQTALSAHCDLHVFAISVSLSCFPFVVLVYL